jgi:cob(I)alamin adenosyltransferase
MVRLTKIYTRGGDGGRTSLGDGTRVSKTHWRITAFGAVDELNAALGAAAARRGLAAAELALLRRIQNDLFDVGADLCVPQRPDEGESERLRLLAAQVTALEAAIDARNAKLQELSSFVLPGGTPAAAALHVARAICRRAEVTVAAGIEAQPGTVGAHVLPYLNRLSDLLFVMARWSNRRGRADVLWRPGAGRVHAPPAAGRAQRQAHAPARSRAKSGAREAAAKPRRRRS